MSETLRLHGRLVTLEAMRPDHLEALCAAGLDPAIWRWMTAVVSSVDDMKRWMDEAFAERDAGRAIPFVTIDNTSGTVAGSTRFGNVDRPNRRAEIGWTWLAPDRQRSGINVEAKLLMLEHAFESMACERIEFKTDVLNTQSRAALRGIGAVEEGVLRHHMLCHGGRWRDSIYYSVLRSEWPDVRERLRARLSQSPAGTILA